MASINQFNQLTAAQRAAVFHKKGALLVLAGPGSGKTRVITNRIAALIESGVPPYHICAITFTNRAAEEMRQRVISMNTPSGTQISTFHSLCVRVLRTYGEAAGLKPNFSIYDTSEQNKCMREALKSQNLDSTNFTPGRMLEAITLLKNRLEEPAAVAERADEFFTKTVAKAYGAYQQILTKNNAVDFDDLLMKTALLLKNNEVIRRELNRKYQFLLVDEYQDTNHAQYEIARLLAIEHGNICVTGDPDQSIYRWRGADIGNILAFEKDWPDAQVVKLEENFRSAANILEMADKLIAANVQRKAKKLIATKPASHEVAVRQFADDMQEASGIADEIKKLIKSGVLCTQIAVFYRVNSMSRPIEEACIQAQIPYQIVRGVEFYARKEIKDMIAYLKVLVNSNDDVSLVRVINTPARGIGGTTVDKLIMHSRQYNITLYEALTQAFAIESISPATRGKIAKFIAMIEKLKTDVEGKVAPMVKRVFEETGLLAALESGGLEQEVAIDNVNELINSASLYDMQSPTPALLDYLQQIALFSDADVFDPASGKVALMTLHAAKGLEFDHVFIVGLEEGILPHERSQTCPDDLEEERRLFFVGITRARAGLQISFAQHRLVRGLIMRSMPSQFLYEIGATLPSTQPQPTQQYSSDYAQDFHRDEEVQYARPAPFVADQLVQHKVFGLGRVQKFADMGDNSVVTVKFNSGQTKTLMLKYASLTKV